MLVLQTGDEGFIQWFAKLTRVDFHACMHGSERDKDAFAGLFRPV